MDIDVKITNKQQIALDYLLNSKEVSTVIFGGAAGGGKAQPLWSKVLTPKGWVNIGDVKVGDEIIAPNNIVRKVNGVFPQGKKVIYKITMADDRKTYACGEHLWLSKTIKNGKEKIRTTFELIELLKSNKSISLPLIDKIEYGDKHENKFNPYLIGSLLGDGGLTNTVTFTTSDEDSILEIQSELPEDFIIRPIDGKYAYRVCSKQRTFNKKGFPTNELKNYLVELGLFGKKSEHKFIPKVFLEADFDTKISIIQGLMDTDGTVDTRGYLSFCNKSKQLTEDLQYLIRSIGGKATLKEINKSWVYKDKKKTGTYYQLYINTKFNKDLFRLKRKKERCQGEYNGGRGELSNRIKSIEEYSFEEAQCISIDSPDHLYITDDFIVTHNSFLGCLWLVISALKYPKTRWLLGRSELSILKKSTLVTLLDLLSKLSLKRDEHWTMFADSHIDFKNGSRILFMDLKYMPSDPNYDSLGSLEISGAFIEEIPQVTERCYELVISRIRYKLDEYGLTPKLFGSCNPNAGWGFTRFYLPFKKNTLPSNTVFIPALTSDNPYVSKHYIDSLSKLNDNDRERLLLGNWEFEDDAPRLFNKTWLDNVGTEPNGLNKTKYMTVDVARFGEDDSILCVWEDNCVIDLLQFNKLDIPTVADKVLTIMQKYNILAKHILIDEAGVGGGVLDILHRKGCKVIGFIGASSPLRNSNFANLRQECYFTLVDSNISISDKVRKMTYEKGKNKSTLWEAIFQDLYSIKRKITEDDKPRLISKSIIKTDIGRSPDLADVISMREYFNLKPRYGLG